MDLIVIRCGLVPAVVATLLSLGCRSPAPPAPVAIATVAVPPPAVDTPLEPEPVPSPWDRLLAVQAVFSGGTPEPPCPADQAAMVLVTGEDEEPREALAEEAGCVARSPVVHGEIQLCCPAGLEAPTVLRTGGGKSCEQAQQEYVASPDPETGKDGPDLELTAGMYGAILNRGQYLNACSVGNTLGVFICAAVQHGRAQGVTVRTTPASIEMADCVAKAVRGMSFPNHPRMDITRTTFAGSE